MTQPRSRSAGFVPPRRSSLFPALGWMLLTVVVVAVAWWLWWRPGLAPGMTAPAGPATATAPADPADPPPTAAPESQADLLPLEHHPVEALAAPAADLPAPADADSRLQDELTALLGAQQVATFLLTDGFARRAVVTVDNLARPQAVARLWPVQPTPGRFAVDDTPQQGPQTIAADNADRYRAFITFAEAVPLDPAVQLYARLYPLFQTAYEELGYPGRHFNDRLVQVLDHLLAAPEPAQPLAVQLTPVEGEVPSLRPWVRYEFVDPQLQALSSGHKLLLRMGLDNARRLKAVLVQVRQRVATGVKVQQ